ncbi:hypothetical protein [Hyphomonas sp.]|uniref:hypothetical protein n=1 Tax=Hyphomonas sp. TaxID=87 RepID=UPI00391A5DA9
MIDAETLAALETHLAVRLAVTRKSRLRELAQPHGADAARKALARELAASLAGPFDITPSATRAPGITIPGPTDGRASWADPEKS